MDFEIRATNAEFWFHQSDQMLVAGELLYNSLRLCRADPNTATGCHKGSMFLLGIALENALKGVLAANGGIVIKGGKLDRKSSFPCCRNHNLEDLACLVGLDPSDNEAKLLKRLTVYTVWAGKYGTPIEKDEYAKAAEYTYQRGDDFSIARGLIGKLRSRTDYDESLGWPEPQKLD